MTTKAISEQLQIDPNVLGTVLRNSQLTFTVTDGWNNREKCRYVELRTVVPK